MRTPVITTLESTNYPVEEVNFPGVSICNVNKLDRIRAKSLAKRLDNDSLIEILPLLGSFYDYSGVNENSDQLIELETILDKYFGENGTESFNPFELLKELTTPCSEMLSNCFWGGEEFPCMDLFVMDTTMEGFCCLFNYIPGKPTKIL